LPDDSINNQQDDTFFNDGNINTFTNPAVNE
jgi:hypothetical protein